MDLPSRSANFQAIVREVEIQFRDLAGDHSWYSLKFADAAARSVSFEFETSTISAALNVPSLTTAQVGITSIADLTAAQITDVESTMVTIDAGIAPIGGGGIEVRWSDSGWGQFNDENLAGRFTTQTFTLPRLSKVEDYYLRQYDASSPPRYSRHTTALHVDMPF